MLTKSAAVKASRFLNEYALKKDIYMKVNYFNADHVHALIDLPTSKSIEEVVQLFKGGSSHWINDNRLLRGRFAWVAVTEPSRCLILMLIGLPLTSPARKNIIVKRLSIMSLRCL